jgi:hypothetical protein
MPLPGGNFLSVRAASAFLYFDVLDSRHTLLSEYSPPLPSTGLRIIEQRFVGLVLADADLDGKLDLIAAFDMPQAAYGGFWTFLGNGDGSFQPERRIRCRMRDSRYRYRPAT